MGAVGGMLIELCLTLLPPITHCLLLPLGQEEWERHLEQIEGQLRRETAELSRRRRAAASRMGSAVEGCLRELSMGRSRFDVKIAWRAAKEVCVLCGMSG